MSYGIKYKFRAETVKYKDDIKINILEKDYAGASTDKYLGGGGVTLTKDSAGVICGTSLSFYIHCSTDFEFIDFFEADPRKYQVQLLVNDVTVWVGYLIGDEYRETFKDPPYDVAVMATDGLGLLKNYTYIPIGDVDTKTNRIDVIDSILENTGLSLDIIVGYDVETTGGTNIFQVDFSDDYYSGWTCYEVLEKMIPPDATITQHKDQWLIRRNELDSEGTHVNFKNPYVGNDGKVYQTVKIGNQIWLAENLAETKFANGDAIPVVTGAEAWAALDTAGMCAYNNDADNVDDYGYLYNWYAATDARNIAASGWHVPTESEYVQLWQYLDPSAGIYLSAIAGGMLKETGTTYWDSPNTGATNEVDFNARGAGYRSLLGTYSNIKTLCILRTSDSSTITIKLIYNSSEISRATSDYAAGATIRLIKDDSTATTGVGETPLSLAPLGSGDVYPIGQAELNMQHAWNSLELFSEHGKRPSFLQNHNFADGLTSWTEGPTTGYTSALNTDAGSYVRMTGEHAEASGEDVPDVYISQSFPYVSTDGEGFALELKYCANGYVSLIGTGLIKQTEITIKGRVKYTDGTTTLYLDETDGWTTTNKNFEHKQIGNVGVLNWTNFKIYTDNPPLASGTMTVYLYGLISEDYKTLTDVNFTDIVVHPFIWQDYPKSYRYDVALKENATETGSVTILPTSGTDLENYDRLFYNVHTSGSVRVDAFTSGGNTYTFPNLILNSLKFLHGVTRQMLSGYFRGSSLTLNSVISCAATSNRKYIIESGAWEVLNDKFKLDLLEIPGTADGSTWSMGTTDYSTSGEWSDNTTLGSASSETIGGGGIVSAGGSWLDSYFELVNAGTTGEYIRALRDFASTGEITAYNAASPTGSFWDNMPFATTGTKGVVIVDGTTITITDGVISSTVTGGGGEGVTDHGALIGLSDNDHPQYSLTGHSHVQYITGFIETDPIFTAVSGMFSTTGHTHDGYLTEESDPIFAAASGNFSTTDHNHGGTYEPAFSKNTAFNKDFGTTSGTVCQGNDSRLSDARTPTSHTHGSITNDGKIGSTANIPIITTTAGLLSAGSFGTDAATFAEGNDSRFHTHTNSANLNEINQDLGTGDDVHFLSADVTTLEVDTIIDGIIQSGAGANLLLYSGTFDNANWTKTDVTLTTGQTSPFNAANAYYANAGSAGVIYQSISHTTTGNYVFSIWIKAAGSLNVTLKLIADTSTLIAQSTASVTTAWHRFSVTGNYSGAHTAKRVQIETGSSDVYIFGAQLESGTAATRYTDTAGDAINAVGAYVYGNINGVGDLHLSGDAFVNSLTAIGEVTAYSDQRLKSDISPVADLLERLKKIQVIHYKLINDRGHRDRIGIIAQQLLPHFPEMVEGSTDDYYSVNYSKLAVIAIKAIQELTVRVEQLEKKLNGITGK